MLDSVLRAVSEELIELSASGHIAPQFSARHPKLDAEGGYRAMRRLHQHRVAIGWKPVGRKVGFTNRTIWARYGVDRPIWGFVYDHTLIRAVDNRAEVALEGLAQPRIEPEICFGLKAPPPRSHDAHALLAAIEWVAHSVEIVQCFHPGWKVKLPDCTAANGLHGRLVIGTPVPVAKIPDLEALLPAARLVLRCGGKPVDEGIGANVLDSPLFALAHLVELLAIQPDFDNLHAGEIVSTGTLTDAHPVSPGETWSTAFEGLPLAGLTVKFT
ncbi:MAG: decarboxylase [Betaproteobacteria bacterium]|nr:decarboxylase [Betaproteobacteria bacterium]